MHTGFIIGGVFLALCIVLSIYIVTYKESVLTPIAEKEMIEMKAMNCEQIAEHSSSGLFWSVENYKWAKERTEACEDAGH